MSNCRCSHGGAAFEAARENAAGRDLASPSRRGFFHVCIAAMTAIAGLAVAFPILSFLRLPKRINAAKSIEVPLAGLSESQALFFEREGIQIVLINTNKEPKAYDAACTHLGCLVSWDQNDHVFRCPCHGAVFDDQGAPVSGPVNVPLRKIKFEINKGVLVIA